MKYFFIEDLKRAFISKRTIITFILTFLLMIVGMGGDLLHFFSGDSSVFYIFMNGYNSGTSNYLILFFPLIAAIPYATSFLEDQKSGFNKYISVRTGQVNYCITRFFVNGLVGGASLFVPSFIIASFLCIFKFITGAAWLPKSTHETLTVFNNMNITSVPLMLLIVCSLLFCCGFTIATLTLGLSLIIRNSYLAILTPFIFLLFSGIFLAYSISTKLYLVALYDIHHFFMPMSERALKMYVNLF